MDIDTAAANTADGLAADDELATAAKTAVGSTVTDQTASRLCKELIRVGGGLASSSTASLLRYVWYLEQLVMSF